MPAPGYKSDGLHISPDRHVNYKKHIEENLVKGTYTEWLEGDKPTNTLLAWYRVLEVVSAEKLSETTARVLWRFPVQREYLNPVMTIQGGLLGAMFDVCTTWTLDVLRRPGWFQLFGTSRTMNLAFLRPAWEGDIILMDCEIVQSSKRFALIRGVAKREKDGAVIGTCEHEKYNVEGDLPKA